MPPIDKRSRPLAKDGDLIEFLYIVFILDIEQPPSPVSRTTLP